MLNIFDAMQTQQNTGEGLIRIYLAHQQTITVVQ